jgi:hypothetical protein
MPGLGQIYVGYYEQGFINAIVVASLITLNYNGVGQLEPLVVFFLIFYWLYNVIDAGRRAAAYNDALAGIGTTSLPEEGEQPRGKGSLFGGVLLLVLGVVALSHTLFGLPIDWVERWWPIALIGVGGYLVYQALISPMRNK